MKLTVDIDETVVYAHHEFADELVDHHILFIFIDDLVLYLRPKAVYKRLDLKFERIFFVRFEHIPVYTVDVESVLLPLGLRRIEL